MFQNKKQKGAVLLVTILIMSAAMLSFAIVSATLFTQELNVLSSLRNKKMADSLSSACLEIGIDRLGRNAGYTGNETIALGSYSCTLRPISGGPPWIIEASATISNQTSRFRVTLSSRSPAIIASWQEVVSF